ncbi:MAG: hypothetical protein ABL932_23575, partial [Terricaulis sp.]
MSDVPAFTRPAAFAATELILDIFHTLTTHYQLDLEAIWILTVVGHETMRPWILDPELAAKHMTEGRVPDDVRGSISRLMVADRTGLPRETVRRRISELSAAGFITLDEKGYVRLTGDKVSGAAYQTGVGEIYSAVERYRKRVAALTGNPGDRGAHE